MLEIDSFVTMLKILTSPLLSAAIIVVPYKSSLQISDPSTCVSTFIDGLGKFLKEANLNIKRKELLSYDLQGVKS
jgi:hypothetical protein